MTLAAYREQSGGLSVLIISHAHPAPQTIRYTSQPNLKPVQVTSDTCLFSFLINSVQLTSWCLSWPRMAKKKKKRVAFMFAYDEAEPEGYEILMRLEAGQTAVHNT